MSISRKNIQERYGLDSEVRFCTKCTISNQRPRIGFDEAGVCSACRYAAYKHNEVDWPTRDHELRALCDRFRRDDGGFDVVVPSSGGKDSSFVAHQLKYQYGMHPLTATWAPHLYTDIGFKNFREFIDVGGFENVLGSANGHVHRRLTRLAFEELGDPFQPFIYGQANFPMQVAVQHGISLIMYGEQGEVEYGGEMKNAYRPTRDFRMDHSKQLFSGFPPEALVEHGVDRSDLHFYLPPSNEILESNKTEIHFFGYYKKWVPQENYYYAVEHTGFQANTERSEGTYSKYASLDDQLDGFHYYLAFIKFGIGRATSDSAHEIRDGHLTRDEGIRLVQKYDGEFPKKYFETFLRYCDITEKHFHDVVESWRSPHLWESLDGEWRLRHRLT